MTADVRVVDDPAEAASMSGSVNEMRGTKGSSPASGTPTTSRAVSSTSGLPGNRDAQWPSEPRPSRMRSNDGVPAPNVSRSRPA